MIDTTHDVLVLGAGMAGLAAARQIAQSGRSVLVVEARDGVGGRIMTRSVGEEAVELGAEFVHGKPPVLWKLIEEAGLQTYELLGKQFCWEEGVLRECSNGFERDMEWLESLKQWDRGDCSFAEYLDFARVPAKSRKRLIGYVEGFNAADHREIGIASLGKQQAIEDATEGDRLFHLRGGYSQVPEFLAQQLLQAGGEIILNTRADSVQWKRGAIEVECIQRQERHVFGAAAIVIALPLGVLQCGSLRISPAPIRILNAISQIRMGHVQRMVLLFRKRFWTNPSHSLDGENLKELSFLYSSTTAFPTWWTQFPEDSRSLTAWVGGPRADMLAEQSKAELERGAIQALAEMFRMDGARLYNFLLQSESHDWQQDPLAKGSYSYLPAGALLAPESMCVPVENTLFFAGEHTDTTGNWGTVHGAMGSGVRAANQILGA